MNINFLQINLQRSSTAQSLASQTAAEIGAQVLLFSEQNWSPARDDRWVVSTDGTCAVVLTPMADFVAETSGSGRGFAWMQTRGVRIYSCYISRNDSDANFSTFLGDVEQSARSADPSCTLILGGDFNAWSQEWGSTRNDPRGDQLADLAASLDLLVANSGTTPTYRRVNSETIIDVTFYRTRPPSVIRGWKVLDEVESVSDHRYIGYCLDSNTAIEEPPEHLRGWSYRRLDVEALVSHLAEEPLPPNDVTISANEAADSLVNYLASACDSCMPPRAAPPAGRRHVHWWNQDIKLLREDYGKALRKYQRAGRRHDPPGQLELFRLASKAKRKELQKTILPGQKLVRPVCSRGLRPMGTPVQGRDQTHRPASSGNRSQRHGDRDRRSPVPQPTGDGLVARTSPRRRRRTASTGIHDDRTARRFQEAPTR